MIGHAVIYIQPLQRSLSMDKVSRKANKPHSITSKHYNMFTQMFISGYFLNFINIYDCLSLLNHRKKVSPQTQLDL